jgi:hypothetical protein
MYLSIEDRRLIVKSELERLPRAVGGVRENGRGEQRGEGKGQL